MAQHRAWCFTVNNPPHLLDMSTLPFLRYGIYSEEIGESGTYHLQGYLEFSRALRMGPLKEMFGELIPHLEPRMGTREQAREYCCDTKDPSFLAGPYEFGEWNAGGQGRRNDLASFKSAIDSGETDLQLWDSHPAQYLRYMNGVSRIRLLKSSRRDWPMDIIYLVGPPGTGKSKAAMDLHPLAYWVSKGRTGVWWDGYQGESTVILDELDGTWFTWTFLMRLLDRYPMNVEFKGGSLPFLARTIIITSNKYPWELYNRWKFPLPALFRRITEIRLFSPERPPVKVSLEELCLHVCSMSLDTFLTLPMVGSEDREQQP